MVRSIREASGVVQIALQTWCKSVLWNVIRLTEIAGPTFGYMYSKADEHHVMQEVGHPLDQSHAGGDHVMRRHPTFGGVVFLIA